MRDGLEEKKNEMEMKVSGKMELKKRGISFFAKFRIIYCFL